MDIEVFVKAEEQKDEGSKKFIREQISRTFAKFQNAIRRVRVVFKDENGPRGGVDQICQIEILWEKQKTIFLKEKDAFAGQAFTKALTRAKQVMLRRVGRLHRRRFRIEQLG